MFVTHELPVTVSFAVAQARLASLARGRELCDARRAAYGRGLAGLLRAGPAGDVEVISELAAVASSTLSTARRR
jgi:hypothetical protein